MRHYSISSSPVLYLLGLSLLTWYFAPLASIPSASIPAGWPQGWQGPWVVWILGFSCRIWSSNPFFSPWIFAPHGGHLYELPLGESLVLPARCLTGDLMSVTQLFSYLCLAIFIFNYTSAYLFFRTLSKRHGGVALVLSLGFAFHPFFIQHLRSGDIGALFIAPLLVYLHLLILCFEDPPRARQLQPFMGLMIVMLAFSDIYYLFFAGVLTGLWSVVVVWRKLLSPRYVAAIAAPPFAVAIALASVKLIPLIRDAMAGTTVWWGSDPLARSADLVSLFLPGSSQVLGAWWPLAPHNLLVIAREGETGTYLGFALLIGAITSIIVYRRNPIRHPLIVAMPWFAVLMVVLSLGPVIQMQGRVLSSNPFFLALARGLPMVPGIPARFAILAVLLLAILLALQLPGVLGALSEGKRKWLPLALSALALIEYAPLPMRFSTFHATPVVSSLQKIRGVRGLLDLDDHSGAVLARQIYHGKPLVSGPASLVGSAQGERLRDNFFLSWINEGIASDGAIIARDLEALEVDLILVPTRMAAKISRLSTSPRVRLLADDGDYALYVVQ